MADISEIVPNQAFLAFVPQAGSIEENSPNAELIRGIEAMVYSELGINGITLAKQTYTDEEIHVERPDLLWDNMLTRSQQKLVLRNKPVISFTELKVVESRKASDGTPDVTTVVPRNAYHVDKYGIITLLQPYQPIYQLGQVYQTAIFGWLTWPKGRAVMLATYEAGIDLDTTNPTADARTRLLRLLILQMFARLQQMQKQNLWYQEATTSNVGGTLNLLRTDFTMEERALMNAFMRLVWDSSQQ